MPLHRPVPPPLVGAMLAAVGAAAEHATDRAGATVKSHADAREGC